MSTENPYTPPPAARQAEPEEYAEVRVFTVKGRLGRVRYIGYSMGLGVLSAILMGGLGALAATLPDSAGGLLVGTATVIIYLGNLVLLVLWTIRRVHDFNLSGWFCIVFIIPLINLVTWIIPGTGGENRFGLRPPPNGAGVILLACLVPVVMVVGIVAAIAIPAYNDYTVKAKVREGVNASSAHRSALAGACAGNELRGAMTAEELGLGAPGDYEGKYTVSVIARVLDAQTAEVRVVFKAIGGAVTLGQSAVFEGRCEAGDMTWKVSGTLPSKYLPRL